MLSTEEVPKGFPKLDHLYKCFYDILHVKINTLIQKLVPNKKFPCGPE